MAVGESSLPVLNPIKGVRIGTAQAGIKYPSKTDLVIFELFESTTLAASFTQNRFCAAPVQLCRKHLEAHTPRYLLINTGNANAGTGRQGLLDAQKSCAAVAGQVKSEPESVLPFSTGVIGELLPMDKFEAAIPAALLDFDEDHWAEAASGILTTDTRPKGASIQLELMGETVTLTGISKGSGMIKPNMATMLAFIATDAEIAPELLQQLHQVAVENSFNRITVDSDTSTNDSCILIATGQSNVLISEEDEVVLNLFTQALQAVYRDLAQAIVLDGEGATKFITVTVKGGHDKQECLEVAYTIAHSPLVKTAFFASDPNWGRILAAIGRAPVDELDVDKISVYLDQVCIVKEGGVNPGYQESMGQQVMDQDKITITVELGRGNTDETVWTCDLSHDYVRINAEYRS